MLDLSPSIRVTHILCWMDRKNPIHGSWSCLSLTPYVSRSIAVSLLLLLFLQSNTKWAIIIITLKKKKRIVEQSFFISPFLTSRIMVQIVKAWWWQIWFKCDAHVFDIKIKNNAINYHHSIAKMTSIKRKSKITQRPYLTLYLNLTLLFCKN